MSHWSQSEFDETRFDQPQSVAYPSHSLSFPSQNFSPTYPNPSSNQTTLYASSIHQNPPDRSPFSSTAQLQPVDTGLVYGSQTPSPNAGPSTAPYSNNNSSSFMNSLPMQQQPNSYQNQNHQNFNFPPSNGFDFSMPNMSAAHSMQEQGHTAANPSYYSQADSRLPSGKRLRQDELLDEGIENDGELNGKADHKDVAKGKVGACARCKNLKVRCEFKTDTDPCKRCLNGGHECVIPGRKKRRTPPKREHLLAEIQKQAETIQKLMAQLSEAEEAKKNLNAPRSSASDSLSAGTSSPPILSPSSAGDNSYFGDSVAPNPETNKAVEDWIVKARESLAVFGGFIGMGGASLPKNYIVEEDPEDSGSGEDGEETDINGDNDEYDIAIVDSEGEELSPTELKNRQDHRASSKRASTSSSGSQGFTLVTPPHSKKKEAGEKLATLPSEAAPFGLMANLSLKQKPPRKRGSSAEVEDLNVEGDHNDEDDGVGVANVDFFRASPAPDPKRTQVDHHVPQAPHILTRGLITIAEAEALFKIYFDTMNLSCSLVDPVLYTTTFAVTRSPFLFTVICAIASRFYDKRPELYQQAMHYAQLAAGSALIGGLKNVEMCMAYILLSLYPVPYKRWEDSRSYLYLGLAIRIAIELNLHLPPTAKPQNEFHARDQLNRTRVWINCFNLDRSTSSQYGKRPIISRTDYIANHSENWWKSSEYNLKDFDIQLSCYNAELKIMGNFIEKIYSDPSHPTGLNKDINFEKVAVETDEELQQLEAKWFPILDDNVNKNDPQGCFRVGLLRLAYAYSRLVALSYGFQHAFGRGNQNEKPFLMRCLAAATDIVKAVVEHNNRPEFRIFVRHGPEAQSVFLTFAAAFLVKILQPKFASLLDDQTRDDIRSRVQSVINYLGSPEIAIDERHGPKMYAKFVKNLMASPLVSRKRSTLSKSSTSPTTNVTSLPAQGQQSWSLNTDFDHPSPSTTHSLSPPPSQEALSFDQFAPLETGRVDPFGPVHTGASEPHYGSNSNGLTNGMVYFPNAAGSFTDDEMLLQNMNTQQLPDPGWQGPGMTWLSQFNFQNDVQMMYQS